MPSAILSWAEAAARGRSTAGGKGVSLARLARYGFRVPKGGVLSAEVYRDGLTALPESVRAELALFLSDTGLAETPIAVRSSAVAEDSVRVSFAGIHEILLQSYAIETGCGVSRVRLAGELGLALDESVYGDEEPRDKEHC